MIVFGIHCNIFIVLLARLKTCRYNEFLFFTRQKERARFFGRVLEILHARVLPMGIGYAICPGLMYSRYNKNY